MLDTWAVTLVASPSPPSVTVTVREKDWPTLSGPAGTTTGSKVRLACANTVTLPKMPELSVIRRPSTESLPSTAAGSVRFSAVPYWLIQVKDWLFPLNKVTGPAGSADTAVLLTPLMLSAVGDR